MEPKKWDFKLISRNTNFCFEWIDRAMSFGGIPYHSWDWDFLSNRSDITVDVFQKYIHFWNYRILSSCNNDDMYILLSRNIRNILTFIEMNPDASWEWGKCKLSSLKLVSLMEKYPNKWNFKHISGHGCNSFDIRDWHTILN